MSELPYSISFVFYSVIEIVKYSIRVIYLLIRNSYLFFHSMDVLQLSICIYYLYLIIRIISHNSLFYVQVVIPIFYYINWIIIIIVFTQFIIPPIEMFFIQELGFHPFYIRQSFLYFIF